MTTIPEWLYTVASWSQSVTGLLKVCPPRIPTPGAGGLTTPQCTSSAAMSQTPKDARRRRAGVAAGGRRTSDSRLLLRGTSVDHRPRRLGGRGRGRRGDGGWRADRPHGHHAAVPPGYVRRALLGCMTAPGMPPLRSAFSWAAACRDWPAPAASCRGIIPDCYHPHRNSSSTRTDTSRLVCSRGTRPCMGC